MAGRKRDASRRKYTKGTSSQPIEEHTGQRRPRDSSVPPLSPIGSDIRERPSVAPVASDLPEPPAPPPPPPPPLVDSPSSSPAPTSSTQQSPRHSANTTGHASGSNATQSRLRIYLRNNILEPSGPCSRKIRKIIEEKLDFEAINWKSVSKDTKEFYFEEFKKQCLWDEAVDALVRIAWKEKAATRYRDMVSDMRRKRKKPQFVEQHIWDNWQQKWNTPEAKQRSETYSKNRMSQAIDGSGPSTHSGGTATHYEHARRLAQKLGRPPTAAELFVHTHTKKGDGQTFINQKSKTVHDAIEARREQMTQANEPIDENNIYLEAVGGKQNNRVYGLGSQAPEYYKSIGASTSAHPSHAHNQNEIQQLHERINQQDQEIRELRQLIELRLQRRDNTPSAEGQEQHTPRSNHSVDDESSSE